MQLKEAERFEEEIVEVVVEEAEMAAQHLEDEETLIEDEQVIVETDHEDLIYLVGVGVLCDGSWGAANGGGGHPADSRGVGGRLSFDLLMCCVFCCVFFVNILRVLNDYK